MLTTKQVCARHPRERWVRVGEMNADVAEPRGSQHRVGHRMADGIAVGVPAQPVFTFEEHASQQRRQEAIA